MLDVTVTNRGTEAIHSFALRYVAPVGYGSGHAVQPENGLLPGATFMQTSPEPHAGCASVRIDFVQFASGDVWYSSEHDSLVTEAGVRAGARAASLHLRNLLARSDAATVMAELPRIHAEVVEPAPTDDAFGSFGFYSGVTNVVVRVRHVVERDGLDAVPALLRSIA